MNYPVGMIGWKLAANLGIDLKVKCYIGFDKEANVFIGKVSELNVFSEGETFAELVHNMKAAINDMLEYELGKPTSNKPSYEDMENFAIA